MKAKTFSKVLLIIFALTVLFAFTSKAAASTPTPNPKASNGSTRSQQAHEVNAKRQALRVTYVQAIHAANEAFRTVISSAVNQLQISLKAATTNAERIQARQVYHQAIQKAVKTMQDAKTAAREAYLAGLKAL